MTKVRKVVIPVVLLGVLFGCGGDTSTEADLTTTTRLSPDLLPPSTAPPPPSSTLAPLAPSTQTPQIPQTPATVATPTTTGPTADHDEDSPPIELSVYWESCEDAVAAGAVPILAGTAGYRAGLDPNSDGVACGG